MINEQLKKRFPKAFRIYLKWAKSNVKPMERDKYDFFDEQKIYIILAKLRETWYWDIIYGNQLIDSTEKEQYGENRVEIEKLAFIEAFKMLENRLSKIKPEEIRIGNKFYYKGNIIDFKIEDFTEADNNSQFLELFIKRIPLTGEWLLKFGFNDDDGNYIYEVGRQGFIVSMAQDDDFVLLYREDIGLSYNLLKFINYVNELQNLVFVLTGTELELKNK